MHVWVIKNKANIVTLLFARHYARALPLFICFSPHSYSLINKWLLFPLSTRWWNCHLRRCLTCQRLCRGSDRARSYHFHIKPILKNWKKNRPWGKLLKKTIIVNEDKSILSDRPGFEFWHSCHLAMCIKDFSYVLLFFKRELWGVHEVRDTRTKKFSFKVWLIWQNLVTNYFL
jgi:hypothetical protein